MTTNKDKKQDNDKLVLRFDRVDQLQKQLEEIAGVIKSTDDFSYLDDFRNTVVMGLSSLTNNQRNKINRIFDESGIYKLILDKRKELLKRQRLQRHNEAPRAQKKSSRRQPVRNRRRHVKPKPVSKEPIEVKPIKGYETTYRNKDLVATVIMGQTKKKKGVVQVIKIEDIVGSRKKPELDKVTIGNVFNMDTLPQSLKFLIFPEQEATYLAGLRAKEESRKAYRNEQSKQHKGNDQSNKSREKNQGGKRGKRAA